MLIIDLHYTTDDISLTHGHRKLHLVEDIETSDAWFQNIAGVWRQPDVTFQNQASAATFQNNVSDIIFCDHASEVQYESGYVGCLDVVTLCD